MSPTALEPGREAGPIRDGGLPQHSTRQDLTHPRVDRRFVRRAVEDGRVAFEQVMQRERKSLDDLLRRFLRRTGAA